MSNVWSHGFDPFLLLCIPLLLLLLLPLVPAGYPASEPARETPLLFAQPHAPARFGVGGVLLVVTPTIPSQYASATVEVHALQVTRMYCSVCLCVRVCVCACVRACVRVCVVDVICYCSILAGTGTRVQSVCRQCGVQSRPPSPVSSITGPTHDGLMQCMQQV